MIHITPSFLSIGKAICGVKLGMKDHTYYSGLEWIEIEDIPKMNENLCPQCKIIWGDVDDIVDAVLDEEG